MRSTVVWMAVCLTAAAVAVSSSRLEAQGRRTAEGIAEVLYEDSADGGRLVHFLNTGTERIRLKTGPQHRHLKTGSRIRVRGAMQAGVLALDPDGGSSQGGGGGLETLALASPNTFGPQSTLVILFNFQDLTTTIPSIATATNVTFTQANSFFIENSYGQTSLTGQVVGRYTIAASKLTCDYTNWAQLADTAAANAGVVLSNFPRRIYSFPQTNACNWWGLGTVGGGTAASPSRTWVNGTYHKQVVTHELGHNFGVHHSRSQTCDSSGCVITEYGDDHDVMGAAPYGHLNAYQKEQLGWLGYGSSPSIQTVTETGDYTLEGYANANGGLPKALKMLWTSDAGGNTYLYAEARTQTGADAVLTPGVVIHAGIDVSAPDNYELDLQTATPTTDFILNPGQSITFENAFTITTVSSGAFGATLSITDLSPTDPTSLAPSAATGPYGGTTTLSATLTAAGSPVAGRSVAFTLNGTSVGSATTNASGVATLTNVSLSGLVVSSYPSAVQASFAGDSSYDASAGTASLTVTPKQVAPVVTAANKTYDRSTTATLTSCTVTGVVGSDAVACTGTATFAYVRCRRRSDGDGDRADTDRSRRGQLRPDDDNGHHHRDDHAARGDAARERCREVVRRHNRRHADQLHGHRRAFGRHRGLYRHSDVRHRQRGHRQNRHRDGPVADWRLCRELLAVVIDA